MNFSITEFKESDREELRQIYKEVRESNFTWLEQGAIELVSFDKATEGELILVAKTDSEIAGFISIWLEDNFIHHLYIKNEFQREGIGTKLLTLATKITDSEMTLKCLKKNKSAINFYLKNGWEQKLEGVSDEGAYILFRFPKFFPGYD